MINCSHITHVSIPHHQHMSGLVDGGLLVAIHSREWNANLLVHIKLRHTHRFLAIDIWRNGFTEERGEGEGWRRDGGER